MLYSIWQCMSLFILDGLVWIFLQVLLEQGLTVFWFCVYVSKMISRLWMVGDVARRPQTSYGVARLLLMVPIDPWRNSTPLFGAEAFCTTKIDDFRTSLTLTSSTTLSTYWIKKSSLRWTSSKRKRRSLSWTSSKGQKIEGWAELCHTQEN